MDNDYKPELDELLKEAETIASYLIRQVNSRAIQTQLDIRNIERFVNALKAYKEARHNNEIN